MPFDPFSEEQNLLQIFSMVNKCVFRERPENESVESSPRPQGLLGIFQKGACSTEKRRENVFLLGPKAPS